MIRLDCRKNDLEADNNVQLVSDESHAKQIELVRLAADDGRVNIKELFGYLDWILDNKSVGFGSFYYACQLMKLSPKSEAQEIITKIMEGKNHQRLKDHLGEDLFIEFCNDLAARFKAAKEDINDPLN